METRPNPFESGDAENFPPLGELFETSPSIDTIARTRPADFSFGGSSVHRSGPKQSPIWEGTAQPHSMNSISSRSPRHPRARVAKQLNFSVPEGYAMREGSVSRKMAKAAGWPTPDDEAAGGMEGEGEGPAPPAAAEAPSVAAMHEDSLAADRDGKSARAEATSRSTGLPATAGMSRVAPARTLEPAESMPRLPTMPSLRHPASALPRSPSAPIFRTKADHLSPTTAGVGGRHRAATGDEAPLSAKLEEVRRALLEPPSFAFTQYLKGLRHRWTQRPLMRSRLSELGLSPSKHPLARPPEPWALPEATAPAPPPWHSAHAPSMQMPMMAPMHAAPWTYPYYWPMPQMAPPYWGAPPGAWPAAPPPAPYAYYAAPAPSSPSTVTAGMWMAPPMYPPMPTWPAYQPGMSGSAFSTATLPASRGFFKYVQ